MQGKTHFQTVTGEKKYCDVLKIHMALSCSMVSGLARFILRRALEMSKYQEKNLLMATMNTELCFYRITLIKT